MTETRGGPTGPVSGGAAARAVAWCEYLQGHARRLYASVTDRAQVAAAQLAAQLTHGRLPSPFTARDVYRNEWTGLTEPRVVQGAPLTAPWVADIESKPPDWVRPPRYDKVHLEPDQLSRQVGQPVDPTLRISIVDDNILALNPPELAQPLPERIEQGRPIGRGRHPKKTYPRHLSRLLRLILLRVGRGADRCQPDGDAREKAAA